MVLAIIVIAVVVLAVLVVLLASRFRQADGVTSFRRQIDALSPEARRPTIGRLRSPDDDADSEDEPGGP